MRFFFFSIIVFNYKLLLPIDYLRKNFILTQWPQGIQTADNVTTAKDKIKTLPIRILFLK